MKPISFEGLRRLVRGNRDKDANQDTHHFRRSNSFKRASLRKSSRRHEKITLPNGLVVNTSALQRKTSISSDDRRDDGYSTDGGEAGYGGAGSSSTIGRPKKVITYDEWVNVASDEDSPFKKSNDDSCPSTMSTNKLSSLDSGVRHSLDSKKHFSIDSSKRHSLDHRKVYNVESGGNVDLQRGPETPTRRSLESNFRRSINTDSPVPPLRFKSLLGSPRVAPKTRDSSPQPTPRGASYSVHNTPCRSRVMGTHSQPISAPSTPGKQQAHHRVSQQQAPSLTPTHQLRSSFHERERYCVIHGNAPDSPLVQREKRPPPQVNSPKPQSRWAAMFSNSIFSRSPSKKNQNQVQDQTRPLPQNSPALIRHRSITSLSGSPAASRAFSVNCNPAGDGGNVKMVGNHTIGKLNYTPGPIYSQNSGIVSSHQPQSLNHSVGSVRKYPSGPLVRHPSGPIIRHSATLGGHAQLANRNSDPYFHSNVHNSPIHSARDHMNGPQSMNYSVNYNHTMRNSSLSSGPSSISTDYGVVRAIGGVRQNGDNCRNNECGPRSYAGPLGQGNNIDNCRYNENGPRSITGHPGYHSPLVLQRQFSQPSAPCTASPQLLRHKSTPPNAMNSPVFRPRPLSSPATKHSTKAFQVLGENPVVVNNSQFYPGRTGTATISTPPNFSPVNMINNNRSQHYQLPSNDFQSSSRGSSQERPPVVPIRSTSNERYERPRTPTSMSKFLVNPIGRPFSLAFNCTKPKKKDLMSPASITSEASSRGSRRRGPSLLVGRTSWLSRASSGRKSNRFLRRRKKEEKETLYESVEDLLPPPPPPRPAHFPGFNLKDNFNEITYNIINNEPTYSHENHDGNMVFVPPQRRRSSGTIKIPQTLLRRAHASEIRTAHAHLLMPLNQPVGSNQIDGRNKRTANLVRSLVEENNMNNIYEDCRDTNSEPGGARYSVAPKSKPKSAPNTTRLNLKLARNPEMILRAFGFDVDKLRRKSKVSAPPTDVVNERLITELLLKEIILEKENSCFNAQMREDSAESLASLVESVVSSRASSTRNAPRPPRRVKRKKSQKRHPSVPAYPSWKRAVRARARKLEGRFKFYFLIVILIFNSISSVF